MNTLILAGSLLLSASVALADQTMLPIAAHFSVKDSTKIKQKDMNYLVSMECGADYGHTSIDGSMVNFTLGDGKPVLTDSGEVGFNSAFYCPKPIAFKNNSDGSFNPNQRVIEAGNPEFAQRLMTIASIHDVSLTVNNECRENDKNCGKFVKLKNSDGTISTVMSYSIDQVTVTFPGAPPKSLRDYFSEARLNDFGRVLSKVNRSPSEDPSVAQSKLKNNPESFFTATEVLPSLINPAKADPTNN